MEKQMDTAIIGYIGLGLGFRLQGLEGMEKKVETTSNNGFYRDYYKDPLRHS